jgi:hypothetical protein
MRTDNNAAAELTVKEKHNEGVYDMKGPRTY